MPYKQNEYEVIYKKGYTAGIWKATREHLGNKCIVCGTTKDLEIHHIKGLNRKSRSIRDLFNLNNLQLLCKEHHNGEKYK